MLRRGCHSELPVCQVERQGCPRRLQCLASPVCWEEECQTLCRQVGVKGSTIQEDLARLSHVLLSEVQARQQVLTPVTTLLRSPAHLSR